MRGSKKTSIVFVILFLFMIVLMIFSITRLYSDVQNTIHQERVNYLSAQTDSVSGLITNTMNEYLDYAAICKQIIAYESSEGLDIDSFMKEMQNKLSIDDARLILVDSNCTWYGENNTWGRITDVESYRNDTPDRLTYITTGVDVDIESFVFRVRLDKPLHFTKNGEDISIKYCSVIYYLDDFKSRISEAFPYNGNSFIINNDGLMLYKDFNIGILVGGTNIYSKYNRVNFLYGDSGEDLISYIKDGGISVAEFTVSDHSYFICTAPLSCNDWHVSFVIDSEELASGSYIGTIFRYIIIMALIFAVAAIIAGIALFRISAGRSIIEKQKQANEYLEKASRAKSEFFSNMSHDIRTPINGIMGMTALAMQESNSKKTAECLKKIDTSSHYLLSLVNDVLDMSKIESGEMTINEASLDLQAFAKNCLDIIDGQLLDRKLEIIKDFDNIQHPRVLADEKYLRQIVINILSNALKFTPDGGEIRFSINEVQADGESAQYLFEIADTGLGMEKEILDNLWTRFKQGKAGNNSKYKGTGLGMAICKKLVDAMNGQINVTSAPGEGSKFSILLSFRIDDSDASETERLKSDNITGARILIAEDNDINMEIISELLSQCGAEITQAENGKLALDIFSSSPENSFDIILMDLNMPEMDGIEATQAIRKLPRPDAKNIAIIAMTANTLDDDVKKALASGMNAFLTKPINLAEVLNTLSGFYDGQEAQHHEKN